VRGVVLIPGRLSDGRVWQSVAAALPEGARAATADVTRAATITGMAEDALSLLEGEIVAIGHSMGGRVAMEMARLAPDRVRGLVLANTGHAPLQPGEAASREAKIALGHQDMRRLAAEWLPPMLGAAHVGDKALLAQLTEMVLRAGPQVHERQIRALIARPDAAATLPRLACPILLLAARDDRWSPPAQHEEMAALAPDATLEVIERAGHFAPLEQPQATARAIAGWLAARRLI
jgi:pimeloyl-ACP methyl ester carboxylesterase